MLKVIAKSALPIVAVVASLAAGVGAAEAKPGWTQLGARQVAHQGDRDVIAARGRDRYQAIRICVSRRAVAFHDVDVHFRNGGSQDVRVRRLIKPGTCTRAIDLKGKKRDISRVVLRYKTAQNRGPQGVVSVLAR